MDKIKYIYTDNLEDLIYEYADDWDKISVVSNLDTLWGVAISLYDNQYFEPSIIDIDTESYGREYLLRLNFNNHTFSIEKACNEDTGKYIGTPGLVLIEDTVNSRYAIDVGHYINGFKPVFFTFDPDFVSDEEEEEPTTVTTSADVSFDWDKDHKGFKYSYVGDGCTRKFAYRSNRELTADEATKMLEYYKSL